MSIDTNEANATGGASDQIRGGFWDALGVRFFALCAILLGVLFVVPRSRDIQNRGFASLSETTSFVAGIVVASSIGIAGIGLLGAFCAWLVGARRHLSVRIAFLVPAVAITLMPFLGDRGARQRQAAKERDERQAFQQFAADMREIMSGGPADSSIDYASRYAGTSFGRSASVVLNATRSMRQDSVAYTQKMRQIGVQTIIAPGNLESLDRIQDGRQRLGRARAAIDEYEKSVFGRMNAIPAAFRAMDVPDQMKGELLNGYRQSASAGMRVLNGRIKLERESMDQMEAMLAFVEQRLGTFTVDGGKIRFATQQDAEGYNAILKRLAEISAESQSLAEEARQQVEKRLSGGNGGR